MSAGRVKFVNVGRSYGRRDMTPVDDLYDLKHYIWNKPSFDAQSCPNWASLDYLLGSRKLGERG
jgi:hypothetical protein